MKQIGTVIAKELKETIRDKRTLFFMLVFPLITFPLIMYVVTTITSDFSEEAATKTLKIGISGNPGESALIDTLETQSNVELSYLESTENAEKLVKDDSLDLILDFGAGFADSVGNGETGAVHIYYKSSQSEEKDRMDGYLEGGSRGEIRKRLKENQLTEGFITPYKEVKHNQSTIRENIGTYAGGILPYFFITFCFMGCLYPAIDLFAGEKERGTIETLLCVPVLRWKILTGKMIVVVLSGFISATLTMIGLFVALNTIEMPEGLIGAIYSIVTPELILMVYGMMLPLAIFFAGVMIPVSIYSRSFKEAQSTLTPLNMVLVLPAIVGFLPGIKLTLLSSFVPVVNIVLATKDLIAGTADLLLLVICFSSLVLLAVAVVALSFRQFGKETNILR